MKDGYIKVGAATSDIALADPLSNAKNIIKRINEASREKVNVLVFQELTLTGYTLNDLFYQPLILDKCLEGLDLICEKSKNKNMLIAVGLPLKYSGKLYNVAAVINKGKILGFVPKSYLPNYNEFYESRHFQEAFSDIREIDIKGTKYPFGRNLLFKCQEISDLIVAVELCEDLWVPIPPSCNHALNGASIILNLSASNEVVGKEAYRLELVKSQSSRLICGYVYASSGEGESTQDLVFSGHNIICENGLILKESKRFKNSLITSEIDVQKIAFERTKMSTFRHQDNFDYLDVYFSLDVKETPLSRSYPLSPFEPSKENLKKERAEQIINIQAYGLKKRVEHTRSKKLVVGLSGGLDSTLAILVMAKTVDLLKRSREDIIAISMPCFGTSDMTKSNAYKLAKALGVTFKEINIKEAVNVHFKDIEQDPSIYDVTYENSQARERTQVLMDVANKVGGMVIGTGDLSELALGWATYNGDHMSMYAVNSSIPKTLIRFLISYIINTSKDILLKETLKSILDTPVSPELIPPKDGKISQITEDLVGPYELHDFFLFYYFRYGFTPSKIFRIAKDTFKDKYSEEVIYKWLRNFFYRFFAQQFKRSTLPDGPKVGSISLSPRGDLRMPSDASSAIFLKELDKIEQKIYNKSGR